MMEIEPEKTLPQTVAREKIAVAAGAALLIAGLVLVVAILPAEFGVDPLGTGAKLGLTALNEAEQNAAALTGGSTLDPATIVASQDKPFRQETVEFKLAPGGGWIEYKYRLDKGQALLFSWGATGPVNFEFHGEPDGAPAGYAETYEKQAAARSAGTFTAPFPGIHGWYWQNQADAEATITLTTAGYYNLSHEFRDGEAVKNKMFK